MAKKDQVVDIPEKDENITEIDVSDEMRGSFLEYAVSVIYARALPDARATASSPYSAASSSRWIRWGCAPTRDT